MIIPELIAELLGCLEASGFSAYLVGGCVRDRALGTVPHDYDATTSATPEEMKKVFASYRLIETGLKHGTLTVLTRDGEPVEITTYRIDGEYDDNRHPREVLFTDRIEDDLARRDFTVNAMAYSPDRGLSDPFGGMEDLSLKIIRCVGVPEERFREDGLRILRALRFASVLDFRIDNNTADAVHKMKELIFGISKERICAEFLRLICGDGVERIFSDYGDVLAVTLGGKIGENVFASCGSTLSRLPRDYCVRLAYLALCAGGDSAHICRFLKTSKNDEKRTKSFEKELALPLPVTRADTKRLMGRLCDDDISLLVDARRVMGDGVSDFLSLYDSLKTENPCVSISSLAITGAEVSAITGAVGREIGDLLYKLLDSVIEETTDNNKAALSDAALRFSRED